MYSFPSAGACGVVCRMLGSRDFVSAATCERRELERDVGSEGAFWVFGGARRDVWRSTAGLELPLLSGGGLVK